MLDLKSFLAHVNTLDLHQKICDFRALDFKHISDADIQKATLKVILFNTPFGDMSLLTPKGGSYPKGTRFYRIRTIPEDDRIIPLKSMTTIDDCWEPPAHVVKMGRLNKKEESLVYTTPLDPTIPLEELKIKKDELFSLIVYEAIDDIKVTQIGAPANTNGLTEEENLKLRMLQDFLHHEFTRDVGDGTEYLYKISESIAKDYFDMPPPIHDGWCYPSIAKKGGFNVCFRPTIKTKLKLKGVQIASASKEGDRYGFKVKVIARVSSDGKQLEYFAIGSPEQQEIFPEISPPTPL
jgi:hypothetical protein